MTRYDRVIPPGGTGQITLGIDTSKEIDEFEKKAVVWSNDPQRKSVALYLKGKVKPHISLIPGGYLSLQGVWGRVPAEKLDIINNHKKPFKKNITFCYLGFSTETLLTFSEAASLYCLSHSRPTHNLSSETRHPSPPF